MQKLLKVIIGLLLFGWAGLGIAQNIPDPSSLSDDQLRSAIERARQSGYTEEQMINLARARGVSEGDIATLRQRIMGLQNVSDATSVQTTPVIRDQMAVDTYSDKNTGNSNYFEQLTNRHYLI